MLTQPVVTSSVDWTQVAGALAAFVTPLVALLPPTSQYNNLL